MIKTRNDLKKYLEEDRRAQLLQWGVVGLLTDRIYRMKTLLRQCEYHNKNRFSPWHFIKYFFSKIKYMMMLRKCCSEIPLSVFGPGLVIWHPERIIVNPNARVGKHCSISSGVVIAQAHDLSPVIGDDVELMIDSGVLGGIEVASNVRIGAKALVLKNILEPNTTWAGIPAKKINDRGTIETPIPIPGQ